jgi:tripartite-type tricarboxylate transporter receptor subunit TctC
LGGVFVKVKILFLAIVLALSLSLVMAGYTAAKPFYEGKTIKIIVGFKPGGGTDFYGRLLAKGMNKYLPGSVIIVKNIPGAASVVALNRIYGSKPDGLTFGAFSRGLPVAQLAGIKGIKFDMTKVSWLGSPASDIYGLYVSSKKYKDLDDLVKAKNTRFATTGLGTTGYFCALLFYRMMGLNNYSLGTGYSGAEQSLAILRGEADALFGSYATQQALLKAGDLIPILFIANSKPPGFENVPHIQEIITEKKYKPMTDFLTGLFIVGRPFVGPPGIPKDRLTILREAFIKAINDPESKRIAKKANKPLMFISPERAEKWVEGIFNLPPDVVKLLKEAYGIN